MNNSMSLVSAEEAAATRRNLREDVQWNIARRDEAFRIANSIVGEELANDLAGLYYMYNAALGPALKIDGLSIMKRYTCYPGELKADYLL
jgi:hypothetical protein